MKTRKLTRSELLPILSGRGKMVAYFDFRQVGLPLAVAKIEVEGSDMVLCANMAGLGVFRQVALLVPYITIPHVFRFSAMGLDVASFKHEAGQNKVELATTLLRFDWATDLTKERPRNSIDLTWPHTAPYDVPEVHKLDDMMPAAC